MPTEEEILGEIDEPDDQVPPEIVNNNAGNAARANLVLEYFTNRCT